MKNKNKILFSLVIGWIIISSISFVSAEFGVGSPKNILILSDNPIKDTTITLQNTLDDAGDLVIKGIILEGEEYVTFVNDVSAIEVLKGKVVQVPIHINVPDAKPGEEYDVTVLFETVSGDSSGGGMIDFKVNVEKSFKIVVYEEPSEEVSGISITWIILGIVIVLIVVVIFWFVRKKRADVPVNVSKK